MMVVYDHGLWKQNSQGALIIGDEIRTKKAHRAVNIKLLTQIIHTYVLFTRSSSLNNFCRFFTIKV